MSEADELRAAQAMFWQGVYAAQRARRKPPPRGRIKRGYPIYSDALAVHPDQRTEHDELCKKRGIPTETLKDGRVVLRDRAHRREYLKAFGFHDRNSYDGH